MPRLIVTLLVLTFVLGTTTAASDDGASTDPRNGGWEGRWIALRIPEGARELVVSGSGPLEGIMGRLVLLYDTDDTFEGGYISTLRWGHIEDVTAHVIVADAPPLRLDARQDSGVAASFRIAWGCPTCQLLPENMTLLVVTAGTHEPWDLTYSVHPAAPISVTRGDDAFFRLGHEFAATVSAEAMVGLPLARATLDGEALATFHRAPVYAFQPTDPAPMFRASVVGPAGTAACPCHGFDLATPTGDYAFHLTDVSAARDVFLIHADVEFPPRAS